MRVIINQEKRKQVGRMKVDSQLIVLNGQAPSPPAPRRNPRRAAHNSHSGVILLISQENQRAWRSKPSSLEEAKQVLSRVQLQLAKMPGNSSAEVHRLDDQCLVRLP